MLRRADHVIPGLDISIPSNWSARRHSFAINHQHPGDPAKLGPAIHSFKPHMRPSHRFDCRSTRTRSDESRKRTPSSGRRQKVAHVGGLYGLLNSEDALCCGSMH